MNQSSRYFYEKKISNLEKELASARVELYSLRELTRKLFFWLSSFAKRGSEIPNPQWGLDEIGKAILK